MLLLARFTPDDFRTDRSLFDTFFRPETQTAALWLLRFLQARKKGWDPFTVGEIRNWFEATLRERNYKIEPYMFHGLISGSRKPNLQRVMPVETFPPNGGSDFDLTEETLCRVTDDFVHALISKGLEHLVEPELPLTGS